ISPVVTPSLTTVHMDMARIAELAIAALVCEIEQAKSTAPTGKTLKRTVNADISKVSMELMVRASSGPAVSPDAPFPTGETL
ncbi:MAG TPA: LacI family transcriptional regulator, partial [Thalassospira sp.]|nr:LacI family transcriptional regulator [Thalassospira sp.]